MLHLNRRSTGRAILATSALGLAVFAASCSKGTVSAKTTPLTHKYRPEGDQTVHIDMTQIHSEELKKVFANIDEHFDEYVERLQKWIRQPSISNSGEGIQESAEMVKGFFDEPGCQQSKVYDTGITDWGLPGNPVVYAKCDEGALKTIAIYYWQYDTMPVTQPDVWRVPPFDAAIVEDQGFKKVLIARGAANSKGPEMVDLNTLMAIRQVRGKLPVNVIFVAEGDEERVMSGCVTSCATTRICSRVPDALINEGGSQNGCSEGSVYVQLTTSGKAWGRGPVELCVLGNRPHCG